MSAATSTPAPSEAKSILSTLNDDGSRHWISPRPSPGRFLTARRAVAYLLIAIFTLIPYLTYNDRPLILLDLPARRFTLLGRTFLPTDTLLLALLMLGVFLTIFFVTALFGRVWCGWACPQTVYMEFLFRPVERLFEGAPGRVRSGGFRGSGIAKFLKYVVYVAASAFLAHTFLAYFVGVEQLRHWIIGSPLNHPIGFGVVTAVTALMLFDFGFFREQVCLVACPYGRFQSALLDRHSLIISYDRKRGEPRGKARRKPVEAAPVDLTIGATDEPAPQLGDCIDCHLCVTTCPTGIDIRNGLQIECIACGACVDACDEVMDRMNYPRGLVRYSTQHQIDGHPTRVFRWRILVYALLLGGLILGVGLSILWRKPVIMDVIRDRNALYRETYDKQVQNGYMLRIINKTTEPRTFTLTLDGPEAIVFARDPGSIVLPPEEVRTVGVLLAAPPGAIRGKADIEFTLHSKADDLTVAESSRFFAPE